MTLSAATGGNSSRDARTPHQRINAFAKPNGAGVNGPGGARLINATKNSATIASQKESQKPSM
jgi:hypothetical protein